MWGQPPVVVLANGDKIGEIHRPVNKYVVVI